MRNEESSLLATMGLLTSLCVLSLQSNNTASTLPTASQRPRPWDEVKELAIGAASPAWRLKTVDGEIVALSELRGNVVVLDFWAHWCKPCRKLEPLFDQLAREYQNRPVKFFTLSIWPDQGFNPQAFMKENKMASTFLICDDAVASDYGLWGVPTYFVIDQAGKISYIQVLLSVEPAPLEKRLRDAIEDALSKPRGQKAALLKWTIYLLSSCVFVA
jgi:thiol-disulfide isomerase/thioredoxin